MEYFIRYTITILPLLVIFFIIRFIKNKKAQKADENCAEVDFNKSSEDKLVLKFPIICQIVSIFGIVVFTSTGVFYFVSQMVLPSNYEEWPGLIMFFLLICCYGIGLVCWSLWKVEAGKDGFVYRNYFGLKREYKFSELEYREHPKGLKWYFLKDGKKVITIAYFIENGNTLYKLYRKYKRKQKGIETNRDGGSC